MQNSRLKVFNGNTRVSNHFFFDEYFVIKPPNPKDLCFFDEVTEKSVDYSGFAKYISIKINFKKLWRKF